MSNKIRIKRIKPAIKYVGSLIQQNHAEALHHGMLIWDTATKQSEFVIIENDVCYYTLDIDSGKYDPIPDQLIDKVIRLRIKSKNTEAATLKRILAKIKSKFNIEEHRIQKINEYSANSGRDQKLHIGDVRDVEYQNELITKYLSTKFILDDSILDGVRHVNRTVNSGLPKLEINRNVSWIPKRFEFSNMFSYGIDNVIDFTNLKGVYGLFAPNASGKSALLDSLSYCIFDTCSRTSKASSVLNNKSNFFKCKFNFELDGKDFFIERSGTKGRGDHVRVEVNFYSIDSDGLVESLNGKERSDTNKQIRQYLGEYEDFVLTALSTQGNNSGFIDMQQRERKDLLAQFLDINIFEDLYNIANNDIKEVATLIKEYQRQDFSTQLAEAISILESHTLQHKNYQIDKFDLEQKLDVISNKILQLTHELVPISTTTDDINSLTVYADQIRNLQSQIASESAKKSTAVDDINSKLIQMTQQLTVYNLNDIQSRLNQLSKERDVQNKLHVDIATVETSIIHKLDKMEKLKNLEYDENCNFCMNNVFVKDAIETKNAIADDSMRLQELTNQMQQLTEIISELSKSKDDETQYNSLLKTIQQLEADRASLVTEILELESKSHLAEAKLLETTRLIDEYHKNQEVINKNKIRQSEIELLTYQSDELKEKLAILSDDILACHSQILLAEKSKERAEESISKLNELTQQYKFYEYYLGAVSRDGVPYDLISSAVPLIEQEINNILSQLVDFHLMLEMDGKNINCYIVYDQDSYWPIELTSGMEKFISSLAIRTSLINISTLPRPNFLVIDEGFGVLDAENLNSVFGLFDYLKTQFTFLLVISHIDSMRDVVDHLIDITKVSGNSKISYV